MLQNLGIRKKETRVSLAHPPFIPTHIMLKLKSFAKYYKNDRKKLMYQIKQKHI
ncbi:MAG: hypothetical protein QXF82_00515 [Nitrososphaeria archaeon]